jgi:hypothetical protein
VIIDEEQIARGKALKRLISGEDYPYLLREIQERIDLYMIRLKQFNRRSSTTELAMSSLDRFQELTDLLDWITDEIDRGGQELMRKEMLNAK